MRLKIISVLAAFVAALSAVQWVSLAAPALATPCPSSFNYDFAYQSWNNGGTYTNVNGGLARRCRRDSPGRSAEGAPGPASTLLG
jgi:hypothetical protein